MERAQPHEVAPIILRAYELSPREEGVVQLLLHGKSNEEISADLALSVYVYGSFTGPKRPLGLLGLTQRNRRRLGPLADRVEDIEHHALSGRRHTLFPRALTYPCVARRIAAYTSFSDVSDGLGGQFKAR